MLWSAIRILSGNFCDSLNEMAEHQAIILINGGDYGMLPPIDTASNVFIRFVQQVFNIGDLVNG